MQPGEWQRGHFRRATDPHPSPLPTPPPSPTLQLIGAYAATAGALLAPLLSGFEYLHALGVGAMMHSGRGLGMEVQPELYVSGALAVLGILVMDAAGKKVEAKRKRK